MRRYRKTGAGGGSAFVNNPLSVSGSVNVTYNPAYYPGSKVPYASIYAEGAFGGIATSSNNTGSTSFDSVGGGFGINARLSGSTIFTVGAAGGYRWQQDTVGTGRVNAGGPFVLGTAGVAWY